MLSPTILGRKKAVHLVPSKCMPGLPYGPDVGSRGRGDRVQVVLVRLRVPLGVGTTVKMEVEGA